jgi:hypothetical protein
VSDETKMAEKVAEGRALDRLAVEQLLASDEEPTLEQKAAIIAGEEAFDYPVHWNDEVAEAYLQLREHGSADMQEMLASFNAKLAEVTREREGKALLQVALPVLQSFLAQLVHEGYRNTVHREADRLGVEFREVILNDALDYARGLMKGCGL